MSDTSKEADHDIPSGSGAFTAPARSSSAPARSSSAPARSSSSNPDQQERKRYKNLGRSFPNYTYWSNDPKDMKLETYFSEDPRVPTAGSEYNLNLMPIIVKLDPDCGDTYLLTDDSGSYFLWNESSGELWKFTDVGIELDEVVEKTWAGNYDHAADLVKQSYDPSDEKAEPEIITSDSAV